MPNHKSKRFKRPILLFTKLESKVENTTEIKQKTIITTTTTAANSIV